MADLHAIFMDYCAYHGIEMIVGDDKIRYRVPGGERLYEQDELTSVPRFTGFLESRIGRSNSMSRRIQPTNEQLMQLIEFLSDYSGGVMPLSQNVRRGPWHADEVQRFAEVVSHNAGYKDGKAFPQVTIEEIERPSIKVVYLSSPVSLPSEAPHPEVPRRPILKMVC